jgi:MFS family permease
MALNEQQTQRALRMSLFDGAFATMMGSLAGGIFLVGFALNVLHATPVQVGILAALPVSANLAQLLGSIWIEMFGRRRWLCICAVTAGRFMWVPVMLLPLAMFDAWADFRVWILVVMVGFSCLLGALAGVAWLEWMSDVIPSTIRGAYLGRRNMVCAAAGMVAVLAGGVFLNKWEHAQGKEDPWGYILLFGVGLVLGLVSSWFLFCVPDPTVEGAADRPPFHWAALSGPFRDRNFLALVGYVGAFMFVTQMAGPFYAVYMIDGLGVDFATLTWLVTFATLASLFMLRIWGPISDQMGNKPVMIVAGAAHALIPLVWVIAQPNSYYWPLVLAHVLSGIFYCALTLAQVNILLKLAPAQGRSIYIAVFNASIGLAVAVAPIVGGWLLDLMGGLTWRAGEFQLNSLQVLFLVSGGLQLVVLLAVTRVQEVGSAGASAVIMQLRNDLDPQTGLASATDFVTVKAGKTQSLLHEVNVRTDDWAARGERASARLIDRLARPLAGPWRTFRKLTQEDASWNK